MIVLVLDKEQIDNWESDMPLQKVKDKKFKTKSEAIKWALDEKKKLNDSSVKWETNRVEGDTPMKWEAVVFKNV